MKRESWLSESERDDYQKGNKDPVLSRCAKYASKWGGYPYRDFIACLAVRCNHEGLMNPRVPLAEVATELGRTIDRVRDIILGKEGLHERLFYEDLQGPSFSTYSDPGAQRAIDEMVQQQHALQKKLMVRSIFDAVLSRTPGSGRPVLTQKDRDLVIEEFHLDTMGFRPSNPGGWSFPSKAAEIQARKRARAQFKELLREEVAERWRTASTVDRPVLREIMQSVFGFSVPKK